MTIAPQQLGVRRRPQTAVPIIGRNAKQGSIPALTAIRGLAAWWVVFFHFRELLPGNDGLPSVASTGYLAVDLFFVLSGFVIALNYLRRFDRPGMKPYLEFLALRLARIYPLHGFMLLLFLLNPLAIVLAGTLPPDPIRYSPFYYLLSIFLVQNWGITDILAWNVPAWSISTEWMAYLVFPAIAWMALRTTPNAYRACLMVVVLLLVLAADMAATGETLGMDIPRTGLIRCLVEFASGAFLYRVWAATPDRRVLAELATIACIALVGIYVVFPVADYVVFPPAWCCLIYALAQRRALLSRLLSGAVLEAIGEYSYSTYMAHYFVRDWVKFLLVRDGIGTAVQLSAYLIATAAMSVVLYRIIEIPGRRRLRSLIVRAA
jgi:peptidoglycan/LPS O-acetylase OafA/YrhL